jgi:hypothetical protein
VSILDNSIATASLRRTSAALDRPLNEISVLNIISRVFDPGFRPKFITASTICGDLLTAMRSPTIQGWLSAQK